MGSGPEKVRLTESGEHIVSNVHAPSITAYIPPPEKATGAAVIVIPGGGHVELWMDHEGYNVAQFLKDHGIAAFVLKYRLAREKGSSYSIDGDSLPDVQRAIRMVRSDSVRWHLDPERIGVMGFSAGGELAALAAARYDNGAPKPADEADRQSSRPSFQALLYPAIPAGLVFSREAPPAFLLCGDSDMPAYRKGSPSCISRCAAPECTRNCTFIPALATDLGCARATKVQSPPGRSGLSTGWHQPSFRTRNEGMYGQSTTSIENPRPCSPNDIVWLLEPAGAGAECTGHSPR